jgi:hypothetical protein
MSGSEQVSYPVKQKSGWYVLSDGRKVRGEGAAVVAEAGLVTGLTEPVSVPDAVPSFVDVEEDMWGDEPVLDPDPVAPLPKGTVFVDCRIHPSGNGTGLAAPSDLSQVVDHSFCPAP